MGWIIVLIVVIAVVGIGAALSLSRNPEDAADHRPGDRRGQGEAAPG